VTHQLANSSQLELRVLEEDPHCVLIQVWGGLLLVCLPKSQFLLVLLLRGMK
jgi:hypothetical protein